MLYHLTDRLATRARCELARQIGWPAARLATACARITVRRGLSLASARRLLSALCRAEGLPEPPRVTPLQLAILVAPLEALEALCQMEEGQP